MIKRFSSESIVGLRGGHTLMMLAICGGGATLVPERQPSASAQESSTDEDDGIRVAIEGVIREQEAAWNRGDVEAFAEHWKSDDLTFSSGGKTTRGWAETLQGYRERYPTPEKMGHVTFSQLEITPLGDTAAMVLGQWRLERESDPVGGNFTLVFRKLDGAVTIHDHTSRLAE